MAKRKRTKGETNIYKTLHRNQSGNTNPNNKTGGGVLHIYEYKTIITM